MLRLHMNTNKYILMVCRSIAELLGKTSSSVKNNRFMLYRIKIMSGMNADLKKKNHKTYEETFFLKSDKMCAASHHNAALTMEVAQVTLCISEILKSD